MASPNFMKSSSSLMQLLSNSKAEAATVQAAAGAGKVLVRVSWMESIIWEVRLVVKAQETVQGVIQAALAAFAKEGRSLASSCASNPSHYALYLSRFSLQSLDVDAQITDVGARSFVLRKKV